MTPENFAHGVSRVDVVGGMVRFEFFTLQPPAADGEPPVQVPTQAVIVPMDGFLRAFAAQQNVMQQLMQAGIIARREDAPAGAVPAAGKPASPNFP